MLKGIEINNSDNIECNYSDYVLALIDYLINIKNIKNIAIYNNAKTLNNLANFNVCDDIYLSVRRYSGGNNNNNNNNTGGNFITVDFTLTSYKTDINAFLNKIIEEYRNKHYSELDDIIDIGKKISKINKKYDDWDNNYKFIDSIIDISTANKKYNDFVNDIIEYNTAKKNITINYLTIWTNIIDALESFDKNEKTKFENFIFTMQLKNLSYWIDTYKIIQ